MHTFTSPNRRHSLLTVLLSKENTIRGEGFVGDVSLLVQLLVLQVIKTAVASGTSAIKVFPLEWRFLPQCLQLMPSGMVVVFKLSYNYAHRLVLRKT